MNKIMCLIVAYIFFINLAFGDTKIPIQLLKVYDGDTIFAKIENEKFLVRLTGVDCYETKDINRAYKQAYQNNLKIDEIICKGKESKEYLEKLYKKNENEELLNNGGCLKYNYK